MDLIVSTCLKEQPLNSFGSFRAARDKGAPARGGSWPVEAITEIPHIW